MVKTTWKRSFYRCWNKNEVSEDSLKMSVGLCCELKSIDPEFLHSRPHEAFKSLTEGVKRALEGVSCSFKRKPKPYFFENNRSNKLQIE